MFAVWTTNNINRMSINILFYFMSCECAIWRSLTEYAMPGLPGWPINIFIPLLKYLDMSRSSRNTMLDLTVKTVPPFPLGGRLYSFYWGKNYLFEMEKPSFPTSSILIWESSPFLRWRGPFSQLGEHRPLFNGMLDIFSRRNTVLLTIDLNRKEFHYQKSYQLL